MRTVNSFIGSPIERLEDLRFVRGRGEYVDDLARPGMLHAAVLRSQVAHGRIRSLDPAHAILPSSPSRPCELGSRAAPHSVEISCHSTPL